MVKRTPEGGTTPEFREPVRRAVLWPTEKAGALRGGSLLPAATARRPELVFPGRRQLRRFELGIRPARLPRSDLVPPTSHAEAAKAARARVLAASLICPRSTCGPRDAGSCLHSGGRRGRQPQNHGSEMRDASTPARDAPGGVLRRGLMGAGVLRCWRMARKHLYTGWVATSSDIEKIESLPATTRAGSRFYGAPTLSEAEEKRGGREDHPRQDRDQEACMHLGDATG